MGMRYDSKCISYKLQLNLNKNLEVNWIPLTTIFAFIVWVLFVGKQTAHFVIFHFAIQTE